MFKVFLFTLLATAAFAKRGRPDSGEDSSLESGERADFHDQLAFMKSMFLEAAGKAAEMKELVNGANTAMMGGSYAEWDRVEHELDDLANETAGHGAAAEMKELVNGANTAMMGGSY